MRRITRETREGFFNDNIITKRKPSSSFHIRSIITAACLLEIEISQKTKSETPVFENYRIE